MTTLTFLPPSGAQHYYENVAETFNAQHSTLRIEVLHASELVPPSGQGLTTQLAQYAGAADVLVFPALDPATLATGGWVRDLKPLIDTDAGFASDDMMPGLVDGDPSEGRWAIPLYVEPPVVFYDKIIVETAGAALPDADWTWEQFLAFARRLAPPEADEWAFVDVHHSAAFCFVYLNGGRLAFEGSPIFNDPQAIDALNWYADLAREQALMPADSQACRRSPNCSGRARMWVASGAGPIPPELGILPLPRSDSGGTHPVWPQALYLSASAQDVNAAWQWLTYLSYTPPPPGRLPVRRSVLASLDYRRRLDEQVLRTYESIFEHSTLSAQRYAWFREVNAWLRDEGIPALLRGDTTVEALLGEAQTMAGGAGGVEMPAATMPPLLPSPTAVPATSTEVVVRVSQRSPALQALVADFQDAHPEIRVRLSMPPADMTSGTIQMLADSVDVVGVWPGVRSVSDELFLDLQPLIDADPAFALGDFYPGTLATYRHNGRLWALPGEVQATMLFFNKRLFDAAGLPYPTEGWTWDDLVVAARQLVHPEATPQPWGFGLHFPDWSTLPLLQAAQRRACQNSATGVRVAARIDAPEISEAVQWTLDLAHVHRVMPEPSLDFAGFNEGPQRFREGKVAMVVATQGTIGVSAFDASRNVDLGVVPLPVTGCPVTGFEVTGYALTAEAQDPQAAWAWLRFLLGQAGTVQALPARRSLASTALLPSVPDAVREELRRAYTVTLADYQDARDLLWGDSSHADVMDRLVAQAIRLAWEQAASPQVLLAQAQAQLDAYLACVADDLTSETLVACERQTGVPGWRDIYRVGLSP